MGSRPIVLRPNAALTEPPTGLKPVGSTAGYKPE